MASEAKGAEEGGLVFHPMDQFIVKPLFGGDTVAWYTPTNATLWMGLAILAVIGLLVLGSSKRAIVPSRMQSIAELAYGFIYKMVEDICGKDGVKYFPYIMTLFMFIVLANMLGLLPGAFTTTTLCVRSPPVAFTTSPCPHLPQLLSFPPSLPPIPPPPMSGGGPARRPRWCPSREGCASARSQTG